MTRRDLLTRAAVDSAAVLLASLAGLALLLALL